MLRTLIAVTGLAAGVALSSPGVRTAPPAPQHSLAPASDGVSPCPERELGPGIVFCDDFEDARFRSRWNIGAYLSRWPASQFVDCGRGDFGYESACAAWSNYLTFDRARGFSGYDARHLFPPQSELYLRWYQYISNPFVWGRLEDTSVLLHDPGETIVAYVGTSRDQLPAQTDSGPGLPFVANDQDLDTPETNAPSTHVTRFQNVGRHIILSPGHWYLFEWYLKLNTPGVSDGITRLWIDDATHPVTTQTLRMAYTDMRWLRASDAGKQFGLLRLTAYHQRCDIAPNTCPPRGPDLLQQSQRWDRIVVSTRPIGPLKSVSAAAR